ncbi:hypothetical protein Tco_0289305 [Tanacetum coccineum]
MHNDVEDLIESALNSKLLLINLKSQRLDKEKQEVKNIAEAAAKRIGPLEFEKPYPTPVRGIVDTKFLNPEKKFDSCEEFLSYDNSSHTPPMKLNAEIADTIVESLSPSLIPVEDSDSRMEEIDLFLAFDDLKPPALCTEIPEIIPFIESKEWIETKNELYKMMEAYTERINQQREQEVVREQKLRKQEQATQREQELLAQKQAAEEKEELSPNFVFRQLIEEMCGTKASAEQKQKLEDTMLELLEDCRQKELYCMHNDVEDLIESALNSKHLLINLKSQRLDKEKQEVKNITEPTAKRQTRIASEPEYSLSMGDKHLDTIPETELDVENLIPTPSESEVTFDNESKCDLPVNDESSPIFTTFLNPLFDSNDDFTVSDDESLSDKDVSKENFKIYLNPLFDDEEIIFTKIDPHYFNAESNLIESLLNRDTLIDSSPKFDYLLEEFSGELAHIDPIPPGINDDYDSEGDIRFLEELLSNDSLPLSENESSNFDHHDDPSFPRPLPEPPDVEICLNFEPDTGVLTTKMVKGISEHYVLMPNILLTLPTLDPDSDFTPYHDSLGSGNKIFDPGIFIEVQSERLLSRDEFSISFIRDPLSPVFDTLLPFSFENEDRVFNPGILSSPLLSHRGKIISDFSKSPMMISGGDIPHLDVPYLHFYPP